MSLTSSESPNAGFLFTFCFVLFCCLPLHIYILLSWVPPKSDCILESFKPDPPSRSYPRIASIHCRQSVGFELPSTFQNANSLSTTPSSRRGHRILPPFPRLNLSCPQRRPAQESLRSVPPWLSRTRFLMAQDHASHCCPRLLCRGIRSARIRSNNRLGHARLWFGGSEFIHLHTLGSRCRYPGECPGLQRGGLCTWP